jgi:hypothetical protein
LTMFGALYPLHYVAVFCVLQQLVTLLSVSHLQYYVNACQVFGATYFCHIYYCYSFK